MNLIHLWEHRAFFAPPTVDRLNDAREKIRKITLLKYPPQDTEKKDRRTEFTRTRVRKDAQTHFITLAVERLLDQAPDSSSARGIFDTAMNKLPKGPRIGPGQYETFYTLRAPWIEFQSRFGHLHRSKNGKTSTPEYTILGWYISALDNDALTESVKRSCSRLEELRGGISWTDANSSLPSPS